MARAELVSQAKALGIKYLPLKNVTQLTAEIAHVRGGGTPYTGKPNKTAPAAPAPKAATPKAKTPLPKAATPMAVTQKPTEDDIRQMICHVLKKK